MTSMVNHMAPPAGADPAGTYADIVVREGRTTFAGFDSTKGTLNSINVGYYVTLRTVLTMTLSDEGFIFHNAEGQARAETEFTAYLWETGKGYWVQSSEKFIDVSLSSDTGWKTSWQGGVGAFYDAMNTGAFGGAPSVFDAAIVLIEGPDEPTDWSEQYTKGPYRKDISGCKTLTPNEYMARLDADGNLSVFLSKTDKHKFEFESGQFEVDQSTYVSAVAAELYVLYDYTPVPEPRILVTLVSGLLGALGIRWRIGR